MFRVVPVLLALAGLALPASADYKRGVRALGMLDYARALAEFRSAIADGDRRALFEIGLIYERGHGVPEDPARAARWYLRAAQEATGLAPGTLARRALARVEGKDAPAPSVASLSLTRRVEAPAPIALARVAAKDSPPPPAPSPPLSRRVEAPAPIALARVAAKDSPPPPAPSPPLTRRVEAPAPIALARVAAKDSPPPPAPSPQAVRSGWIQFRAGLYGEALPFFATALATTERAAGRRLPRTGEHVFDLANVKAKDAPAPTEARLWAVRRGRDLFKEGRYAEAIPFIEKALELSDLQLGPEHEETGALLHDLAKLMRIQGRNAEAEPLYKRSVDVFEKALGVEHLRVAGSLDSLAGLYLVQGRLGDAEPLYGRSLAIRENALGAAHPLVAASLNNLAELYRGQGRYAEAEPLHKRSLAITEKVLGPEHPNVGLILSNLTELYRAQGRNAEAEPLNQRSLEILLLAFRKKAGGRPCLAYCLATRPSLSACSAPMPIPRHRAPGNNCRGLGRASIESVGISGKGQINPCPAGISKTPIMAP